MNKQFHNQLKSNLPLNLAVSLKQILRLSEKISPLKDNIRTLVSSFKTHKNSVESLINNTYGSKKGLENIIKKLKDEHGLNPSNTIVKSTEADKSIGDIDDPEEKKVVNYKK